MYSLLLSSEKQPTCLAVLPAISTSPPAASRFSPLERAKLSPLPLLRATRTPLPQLPPLRRPLPRRSIRSFRSFIMCFSRFEPHIPVSLDPFSCCAFRCQIYCQVSSACRSKCRRAVWCVQRQAVGSPSLTASPTCCLTKTKFNSLTHFTSPELHACVCLFIIYHYTVSPQPHLHFKC